MRLGQWDRGIKIESPIAHRYENHNAQKVKQEEAIQRLVQGLEVVSLNIVKQISKGDFVSTLSSATKDAMSDDGDQTSIEFIGVAATEIISKTYDVSGIYVSEITVSGNAGGTKRFVKRRNREKITLIQSGKTITGVDDFGKLKINGTRQGNIISFYIVRGNGINGTWKINADASRLEGKWNTNGGGGASGKWDLVRIE